MNHNREELEEDKIDQAVGGYICEGHYNLSDYKKANIDVKIHLLGNNEYVLPDGTIANAEAADAIVAGNKKKETEEVVNRLVDDYTRVIKLFNRDN